MKLPIPAYLLPVLRLKVQGYTHAQIAQRLMYSEQVVEEYAKRLMHILKESGLWEPTISMRTGWSIVGKQYLDELDKQNGIVQNLTLMDMSALPTDLLETVSKYLKTIRDVRERGDYSLASQMENVTVNELANVLRQTTSNPNSLGNRLLLVGDGFMQNYQWETAITWLRIAEKVFGRGSSQAARAACMIVIILWQMGDYYQAQIEIARISATYSSIMDSQTKISFYKASGVVYFQLGELLMAEHLIRESVKITQELEDWQLIEHYFLARILHDRARTSYQKYRKGKYVASAMNHYNLAIQQSQQVQDYHSLAFNQLAKACLLIMLGNSFEVQQLLNNTRSLFDGSVATSHLEMTEAGIAMHNNDTRRSLQIAREALCGWSDIKFAKGMADALGLIGFTKLQQGKREESLEALVAALCIHPSVDLSYNRRITAIAMIAKQDYTAYRKQLQHFVELAAQQQGLFVYLKNISVDRSEHINNLLEELALLNTDKMVIHPFADEDISMSF